jgi:hypothetical protein
MTMRWSRRLFLAASTAALLAACGPPLAAPPAAADLGRARFSPAGWRTDFTRASVPFDQISSGGPPRDGIPPLDQPRFEPVAQADTWLAPQEPVIHLALGGEARAYPLQILIWHEIVNDTLGGVPVAVTFCPLCNTAIAFDRRLDGRVLDFGTTGNLRHSDLVMWDRQTESWWQQIAGEAIVGELTGRRLTMLPASIVAWADFRQQVPDGRVLSRETGHRRSYGRNPYTGYDRVDQSPFLFQGAPDGRLPPMERVVTVRLGDEAVAYPFSRLREQRVVADTVGGQPVVVFWQAGTVSALDEGEIARSREVGATGVYRPALDGKPLRFRRAADGFVDEATGSRWSVLGRATAGPLAGRQLEPVVHGAHFWFAWAAFKPDTRVAR